MKLDFANNIRRLRLAKDLTQDSLAEELGVSEQTVSRWEGNTKPSYPDIELLPVIAEFFSVTVDELLGCSKAQSEERLERMWEEVDACEKDGNKRIEILQKMHEEYPNDFDIMHSICETGAFHVADRYTPENVALVRECATRILEECTNKHYRERAVVAIVIIENEDMLDSVLDRYTSDTDISRYQLLEWRYARRRPEEEEKYKDIRQRNFLSCITGCFSIKSGNTDDMEDSKYRMWHSKMMLGIINALTGNPVSDSISGDGEVDLWSGYRINSGMSLTKALLRLDRANEAMDILEETVSLAEKVYSIPAGTALTFRCPGLDRLKSTVERFPSKSYNNAPVITAYVNAKEYIAGLNFQARKLYSVLTGDSAFDSVRDTDRFAALYGRVREVAEPHTKNSD